MSGLVGNSQRHVLSCCGSYKGCFHATNVFLTDYTEYVEHIEKEYCHMSQGAFNEGRTKVSIKTPMLLNLISSPSSSKAILSLPLIQEGQLSVTGERMCTKY